MTARVTSTAVALWAVACGPAAALPRLGGTGESRALAVHEEPSARSKRNEAPSLAPSREPRPVPPLEQPWGTADPLALVEASPDRRWVAFCQARKDTNGDGKVAVEVGTQGELSGDRLEGYFAESSPEGFAIEAFGGADPSGRYVALVRGGALLLRNTTTGVDTSIEADLRDDRAPFLHPRYVAFDPTGKRVLFLSREGRNSFVKVLDLETRAETRIDAGEDEIHRAEFDPSGAFVVMHVVKTDTNGNGRLDWPIPNTSSPWMRCTGPLPRYPVWQGGDDAVVRVARVDGSRGIMDVPGLVIPFGDGFVVRAPDGSLELAGEGGQKTTLVKKGCESRVVHADASRHLLLVTCSKKKSSHSELMLVRSSGIEPLGLEVSGASADRWAEGMPRLVPLYPGRDTALFDADEGKVEVLQPGDRVLAAVGTRALLLRERSLVVHERGGNDVKLSGTIAPLSHILRSGTTILVPPLVIDMARGVLVGTTGGDAMAIAADGAVLTSDHAADARSFARGPLKWKLPEATQAERASSGSGPAARR